MIAIEIPYDDDIYIAQYVDNGNRLNLLDEDGDQFLTLFNYDNAWDPKVGHETVTLKLLIAAYNTGYNKGKEVGEEMAKWKIRKAIGIV